MISAHIAHPPGADALSALDRMVPLRDLTSQNGRLSGVRNEIRPVPLQIKPVSDATTFRKNRDRLLEVVVAKEFLAWVVERAREAGLIPDEHFTVDGTLLEAWASLKSFRPKDKKQTTPPDDPGNPTVNFHGEKRSNQTHESKTDLDAKLVRKAKGEDAKLSYSGNLLVENRNGLIINAELLEANGRAERDAALLMLEQIIKRRTS